MKTQLNFEKPSGIKPNRPPNFKFIIGLACICIGVGLLMPTIKNAVGEHHRQPSGQFQAEVRTLIAQVRYLFTPEMDQPRTPARFNDSTNTLA